ncbi:DUF998 domain-containing protein [Sinomonas susongensis]|uniref:DUF998 domain-containing protein n=1 Tax=Sinomonas susongensis TaxID=1324851 RepID=UPI001109A6BA|nr:DUF998 domain-containing protein [Sinomonas susongensis]
MRSRQTFPAPADVRHYLGAWSAVSVVQFFAAEFVVALHWAGPAPYSPTANFISDLGALHCGIHSGREVCSPLNWLMNGSFVLQGLGMLLAAVLITSTVLGVAARPDVPSPKGLTATTAVRVLLAAAGAGLVVVGLVPEDSIDALHLTGAGFYFGGASLALVVLGAQWLAHTRAGWAVLGLGLISLVSTAIGAATRLHVPEPGLLERFMAYPITFGIAAMGAVVFAGARRQRTEIRRLRAARPSSAAS